MTCSVKKNWKDHGSALLKKLIAAREDDDICDLVIRVNNHDIHAHRTVLAVSSDYFKAMLRHDTIENKTGIVNMKDVDYEAVKNCIDFLYSGEISFKMEHCEKHLHAATLMQLQTICDDIIGFMCSNVSTETFFEIKSVASKYDLERVHKVCDEFAIKHLNALKEKAEFDFLEQEYVLMLLNGQEFIHPEAENNKMKILLKWIKADVDNRQELFVEMIKTVDLSRISKKYGKQLATAEPLCYDNLEIMRSLYISTLNSEGLEIEPTKKKLNDSGCNSILVFNEGMKSVLAYDVKTGVAKEKVDLDEDILETHYVAAVVGDELYVFCSSRELFMINWKESNSPWVQCDEMIFDHGGFLRCLHLDGYIYVSGNESLEKYSLGLNQWILTLSHIGSPINSNDRCAMVELRGWIYLIGGNQSGQITHCCAKYNPHLLSYEYVSPMLYARATPGACVHGDKIYVAGGYNNNFSSIVEQYDPETNTWTRLSDMTFGRSNFALIVVNNRILACGRGSKPCAIEEYDPKTNSWKILDIMFKSNCVAPATVAVKENWPWNAETVAKFEKIAYLF